MKPNRSTKFKTSFYISDYILWNRMNTLSVKLFPLSKFNFQIHLLTIWLATDRLMILQLVKNYERVRLCVCACVCVCVCVCMCAGSVF